MTFKKQYESRDRGDLRRPKTQPRGVNSRDEARIKTALRHKDVAEFDDYGDHEEDDEQGDSY